MNLKLALLTAVFSVSSLAAVNAFAEEKHHVDAKAEQMQDAKKMPSEAAKSEKKKAKKHNHMEEKSGMPMSNSTEGMKHEGMKSEKKHDHMKEKN
jgi:hypothetical protein